MNETIAQARPEISKYAPRILMIQIDPDKIRDVIGPGGKMIKKITDETGATIDIEDNGQIKIACIDAEMAQRAVEIIRGLTEDPEIGRIYRGKVKRIVNFGAFVEILPGRDGLVHISELENHRVARVEDVVAEGDMVLVKVIGIDDEGKVRLSRRAALPAVTGKELVPGGRGRHHRPRPSGSDPCDSYPISTRSVRSRTSGRSFFRRGCASLPSKSLKSAVSPSAPGS